MGKILNDVFKYIQETVKQQKTELISIYKNIYIRFNPEHVIKRWKERINDNFKLKELENTVKKAIDKLNDLDNHIKEYFEYHNQIKVTIIPKNKNYQIVGTFYNNNQLSFNIDSILNKKQVSKELNSEYGWLVYTESKKYYNQSTIIILII